MHHGSLAADTTVYFILGVGILHFKGWVVWLWIQLFTLLVCAGILHALYGVGGLPKDLMKNYNVQIIKIFLYRRFNTRTHLRTIQLYILNVYTGLPYRTNTSVSH